MTVIPHRVKRNGKVYYGLIDVKRVDRKTVQEYVRYSGKDPWSKNNITLDKVLPYVTGLMDVDISDTEIREMLNNIGINCNISLQQILCRRTTGN